MSRFDAPKSRTRVDSVLGLAVMTQDEVAEKLGTSRGNVSCIEARAMKKLRKRLAHLRDDNSETLGDKP